MAAVKHILVPTDGSDGACKAAAFAGELARALDAKISVLFVQNEELVLSHAWGPGEFPAGAPYGTMPVDDIRQMLQEKAQKKELPDTVDALGEQASEPLAVMSWGHPAEEVCRFAGDNDVDLIVIGSHGRSGLKRALLGSVSHAVANQAPCPVTIVR
jgi:nucleotide-binding universal stress UspA family protein